MQERRVWRGHGCAEGRATAAGRGAGRAECQLGVSKVLFLAGNTVHNDRTLPQPTLHLAGMRRVGAHVGVEVEDGRDGRAAPVERPWHAARHPVQARPACAQQCRARPISCPFG